MALSRQFFSVVLIFVLLFSSQAYAEVPEEIAIRVLIGEAADQGFKGMVCVGEVLRRRKSIKGFYGYKSKRTKNIPPALRERAIRAWRESSNTNHTLGADHFISIHSKRRPRWLNHCVKTYEYKDHIFYKEIRRPKVRT